MSLVSTGRSDASVTPDDPNPYLDHVLLGMDTYLHLFYGPRCSDYCAGCPTCEAWAARDAFEKACRV